MRNELYEKVFDKYVNKMNILCKDAQGSSSFRDIAINSLCNYYLKHISEEDNKKKFLRKMRNVKVYFTLLDKFPEFKKAELNTERAFPDLYKFACSKEGHNEQQTLFGDGPNHSNHYIILCKKRLEEIAQNSK